MNMKRLVLFLFLLLIPVIASAGQREIVVQGGVMTETDKRNLAENFRDLYAWHWNSFTPYITGQHVYHNKKVWEAIQSSLGQEPTEGAYWTAGAGGSIANLDCVTNQTIKWNGDEWVCAADLTATPGSDTLGDLTCANNQIIRWTGAEWVCSDDIDTDTDTDTLASLSCDEGQLVAWNGSNWACIDPTATTDGLENYVCSTGQVLKWDGVGWACANDTTGQGDLAAGYVSVDTSTFNNNLSGTDTTVQAALNTIDDMENISMVYPAAGIPVSLGTAWTTSYSLSTLAAALAMEDWVFSGDVNLSTANSLTIGPLSFEGSTNDDYETTIIVTDPTADRTLILGNYNMRIPSAAHVGTDGSLIGIATDAGSISVEDTGAYYTGANVEAALQEIGADIAAITVGSPLTTAPTYSDDECTAGEYAFDATYVYFCTATDSWDRIALAGWNNPTPIYPTLSSAVIGTSGTSATLGFSEAITTGTGGAAGWDMSCSNAGAVTMTYSSGSGTSSYVYTLGSTVNSGDTCTADYVQPGDGLEDGDGDDLASITDAVVTNNSTQGGSGIGDLLSEHFTGIGTQETWSTPYTENGTFDPDDDTYTGTHAGFVGDHLTVEGTTSWQAYASTDLGQTLSSLYFRFYVRINSEDYADGSSEKIFAVVGDGQTFSDYNYINIIVFQTSGQLYLGLDFNGGANVSVGSTQYAISTGTVYKVEGRFTENGADDAVEWKINGTSIGSRTGSFLTNNQMRDVFIGHSYGQGISISMDTLDIDSTNYPDL